MAKLKFDQSTQYFKHASKLFALALLFEHYGYRINARAALRMGKMAYEEGIMVRTISQQ